MSGVNGLVIPLAKVYFNRLDTIVAMGDSEGTTHRDCLGKWVSDLPGRDIPFEFRYSWSIGSTFGLSRGNYACCGVQLLDP